LLSGETSVIVIARFSLVPECKRDNGVGRHVVPVQRDIATRAESDDQLAQIGIARLRIAGIHVTLAGSTDARVGGHEDELLLDGPGGPLGSGWILADQKLPATLEAPPCPLLHAWRLKVKGEA